MTVDLPMAHQRRRSTSRHRHDTASTVGDAGVTGISATAGASFFVFGLLRRALTGRENLVLLEHVWVALGSVAFYLWAAGGPVLPGLDVLAVALCVLGC
ncbi:MAG: hypothetical protein ACRDRR_00475 [Pseudonocardiaceae bacterium]